MFTAVSLNGSFAATDLGITALGVGGTITGTSIVTGSLRLYGRLDQDVLTGGNGNDTLIGSGNDTISGGPGIDTVVATRDTNLTLTDTQLTSGSELATISGIEQAILAGGVSANTIDASAFTLGSVALDRDAGNDTRSRVAG